MPGTFGGQFFSGLFIIADGTQSVELVRFRVAYIIPPSHMNACTVHRSDLFQTGDVLGRRIAGRSEDLQQFRSDRSEIVLVLPVTIKKDRSPLIEKNRIERAAFF